MGVIACRSHHSKTYGNGAIESTGWVAFRRPKK
jgi:hypothetical protein